jgi:hypothetical protein
MSTRLSNPVASLILAGVIALTPSCSEDNPQSPGNTGGTGDNSPDTVAPAVVTGLMVKSPAANSLTLQWVAPGDDGNSGQAHRYDIRYSDSLVTEQNWDLATPLNDPPEPKPAGELEQIVIKGLLSACSYYFALKTRDEVPNESDLSNCAMGTTGNDRLVPAAISDLTAQALSDTTYLLTWTASGDDGILGRAVEYDIRYATARFIGQEFEPAEEVDGEPPPRPSGEPDSMTVSGLSPGTNYFFAIKVADEVPNWSDVSNVPLGLAMSTRVFVDPNYVNLEQFDSVLVWYRTPRDGNAAITMSRIRWQQPFPITVIVKHLVGGFHAAGLHYAAWDLTDDDGIPVPAMYGSLQVRLHVGPELVDSVVVRLTD